MSYCRYCKDNTDAALCGELSPQGYRCTRPEGHIEEHVVCLGEFHAVDKWGGSEAKPTVAETILAHPAPSPDRCEYCDKPDGAAMCLATPRLDIHGGNTSGISYRCTREAGHTGDHVACGRYKHCVLKWQDNMAPPILGLSAERCRHKDPDNPIHGCVREAGHNGPCAYFTVTEGFRIRVFNIK